MEDRKSLKKYAWLSITAALLTIGLKASAYLMTGSVGLLSDAIESSVNLLAAFVALAVLSVAALPSDKEHEYGHTKAEYFAGGVEGSLILVAAIVISVSAITRLLDPQPLEKVGLGLLVSVIAALLNLFVARILLRAGRQYRSMTLEADARHLMTDVWTTAGVLLGVVAVALTGWLRLDAIIALAVAVQIVFSGLKLIRDSLTGLMDVALPDDEVDIIRQILNNYAVDGVQYHALRTRQSGAQRFMSVHVQVPGDWTVQMGHSLLEDIEREVRLALTPIAAFTHIEPLEDPRSWEDLSIYRQQ